MLIRSSRLAVLLSVALGAVLVQTAEAGSYVQTTVKVAANSTGKGKVYVQYVTSGAPAPAAPTDGVWSNSTMMVKTSEGDRDALYDFYLYAQPNEGERFYGWSESNGGTDLGTDSPYVVKLQAPSKDGNTEKTYYASFALPPTFTGGDAVDPHDWFKTGNWSGNEVPLSPDVAPILSSGTLAVFDPAGVGAPQTSVTNGAIRMGTENAAAPSGLVINSGEFKPAQLFIGAEPGSWGSVTQNNGTVAFLSNRFAIGYAASSEWSEFVLNDGTNNGARSDAGLSVGYDGKGRFIQNGGIYVQGGDVHVAERTGSAGEMYIRGGTFKLENNTVMMGWYSNPIHLGEAESAYLEVGGATDREGLVELEDGVEIANDSTVKVLTNGTLKVNYISAENGTLLIDGGSLVYRHGRKATGKGDQNLNFVSGLTGFHIGAGGATIDDGGQTVVIHTPITADPALDGANCGQIVKRGSGTLVLPALGEGVSVLVEEGSVGISADNAFSPAQLVFPEGSSGACAIDLYGHELEWSDFERVSEFRNTADVQATLVVDSNADVDISAVKFVGDIKIVKDGEGQLTIGYHHADGMDIEVRAGSVTPRLGHRYYRFKCDGLVTWLQRADGWAMGELELFGGDEKLSVSPEMLSWDIVSRNNGETHRAGCTPDKLFDGDFETYMMDVRASADGGDYVDIGACWFQIDFGVPTFLSKYVWYVGSIDTKKQTAAGWFYNVNDPTRLTLYGSDDGVTWTLISQDRFETENGEDKRSTNEAPVVGGEVTVASQSFGTLAVAAGAELVAAGGDYTVDGIHSGSGAVVSAPDGDIVFSGVQTFLSGAVASPIAVKSGTLAMRQDLWYRFEIRETSWNAANTFCEMQELMLFDADGALISGGLTDCGDEVAPTDMPPGTVSQCGSYTHSATEGPEKLFDGKYTDGNSSRWRETSVRPLNGDYLALVMRLPFGVRSAATYSWAMGSGYHLEDPTSWILEVSTDGVNWTTVSDSTECTVTPRGNWVVSGPYDAAAPVRVNHLGAAATVRVDAGATLEVDTTATEIPGLVYDWEQGGGTITIFNPKAGGTLALVNVPAGTDIAGPLDYQFGAIENAANIKTWAVTVNGEAKARRLRLENGSLTIIKGGMAVFVR